MPTPTRIADADTWRRLIGPALRVVDSLRDAGYGDLDFRLGGGTVLMFRFGHRISKDIDIFTHDAQALGYLSPRLNDIAEHESTLGYQEQANALKLLLPDGDVDFIVAAPVIPDAPCEAMDVDGRSVMLDATSEILAKKLLYRADSFKARDVFDMSAALVLDHASAVAALRAIRRTRPALLRRLAVMATIPATEMLSDIVMTEGGRVHGDFMVERVIAKIAEIDAADDGAPPMPRITRRQPNYGDDI